MQILRRIHDIELSRRDPESPFVKRPLSERFEGYAKGDAVYQLRPAVFHMLADNHAAFAPAWSDPLPGDVVHRASGPLRNGHEHEIMFVFEAAHHGGAECLDRIMAYVAFHDGLSGEYEDFSLDTSNSEPVDYILPSTARPRNLSEWQSLSMAWYSYAETIRREADENRPATEEYLCDLMALMCMEMNYGVSFIKGARDFSVIFGDGTENHARARFWLRGAEIRYDLDGKNEFPQVLTMGRLNEIVFRHIPDRLVQAGMDPYPALAAFDDRQLELLGLFDRPFHSGLAPFVAPVVPMAAFRL